MAGNVSSAPSHDRTGTHRPAKRLGTRTAAQLEADAARANSGRLRTKIYHPPKWLPPTAGSMIPGARNVILKTSDRLGLGAYWKPPRDPNRDATLLIAGGNAAHREMYAPLALALALALAQQGLGVLVFDYRGYGGNLGVPSEAGLALDARAASTGSSPRTRPCAPSAWCTSGRAWGPRWSPSWRPHTRPPGCCWCPRSSTWPPPRGRPSPPPTGGSTGRCPGGSCPGS
jgi:hypothetical protein